MTTGHWDPGYGDIVTKLRRVQSANAAGVRPGATNLRALLNLSLDPVDFDDIRRKAREAWSHPRVANETSYQDHYRDRNGDVTEPATLIPTEQERKNKPHPSGVFLTTRLHNVPGDRMQAVPGFHKPDATMGKSAYKLDGSVTPCEQRRRADLRTKYIGRPSTAAVRQHSTQEELDVIEDPVDRQAAEAWLKLAPDKENVLASLRAMKMNNDCHRYTSRMTPEPETYPRPRTVPAVNRYLREAGYQEKRNAIEMYNKHLYDPYIQHQPRHSPIDVVTQRNIDLVKTSNTRYVHRTKKGNYLLHPEWPPSIPHHRLNGLSSVDVPYFPGRR